MRLILLLLLALAIGGCDRQNGTGQQGEAAEVGPVKGVDRSRKGQPPPATSFADPKGQPTSLAALRGKPVLVNLWATWCAPCVKELPTLDKLALAHSGDRRMAVLAVSQDKAPQGSVEAFLAKLGLSQLGAFHDPEMKLSGALGVEVLPTTILIDAEGRELWRYVGDLDWTSAEARELLSEAGKR